MKICVAASIALLALGVPASAGNRNLNDAGSRMVSNCHALGISDGDIPRMSACLAPQLTTAVGRRDCTAHGVGANSKEMPNCLKQHVQYIEALAECRGASPDIDVNTLGKCMFDKAPGAFNYFSEKYPLVARRPG